LERNVTEFPAHPAWDFAIRLYGAPGCAPACLELQERHGIDVTLMLFCLWLGATRGEPIDARLPALSRAAEEWRRSAVLPIRAARKWLKGEAKTAEAAAALYQVVLSAEIDCEHGELLTLARLAETDGAGSGRGPSPDAAAEGLAAFFAASGVRPSATDRAAIGALLAAAETEIGAQFRRGPFP
jgi:uncharacterized protein (TIGR02444 family)